jgi:hypothetical protein
MSLLLASYASSRSCLRQMRGFVHPPSPLTPNPLVRRSSSCQHGNDGQSCERCRLPVMPETRPAAA